MKKKLVLLFALISLAFSYTLANALYQYPENSDCYDLGVNAYQYAEGLCACKAGYHFEKIYSGKLKCVKDQTCELKYGSNAIADLNGNCICKEGYMFYNDPIGDKYCIEGKNHCEFLYGSNGRYNDVSKSCSCNYGYELVLDMYGAGYICRSCTSQYGVNSYFDERTGSCSCKEGYFLKNGICNKIEYNSYYYLSSYTGSNDVEVVSYKDNKAYSLKIQSTNRTYETRNYVGKPITINEGSNGKLGVGDTFKLEYKSDITGIDLRILNVKETTATFDDVLCKLMYGQYAIKGIKENCECRDMYELNAEGTQCVWKTILGIEYYENYYYDSSSQTKKNSIFDTSDLQVTK